MSMEKIARDIREGIFPRKGRPHVSGVSRMADNPRAILVGVSLELTDDELRSLHNYLSDWNADGP